MDGNDRHAPGVDTCYICQKQRNEIIVPGGPIYEDDLIYVGHAAIPEGETTAYLGAFLIEPKRHVPDMAELEDQEARSIGSMITRVSRILKEVVGAEHVYMFRLGHHVDHLHVWIVPRYPGTPREYWGLRFDEWPDAPRGGAEEIEAMCENLKAVLK
jgi:histidine triad (HIT) family protein